MFSAIDTVFRNLYPDNYIETKFLDSGFVSIFTDKNKVKFRVGIKPELSTGFSTEEIVDRYVLLTYPKILARTGQQSYGYGNIGNQFSN